MEGLESVIAGSHILGSAGLEAKLKKAKANPEILNEPMGTLNPKSLKEYTNDFVKTIIDNGGDVTHKDDLDDNGNLKEMTPEEKVVVFDEFIAREKTIQESDMTKENKVKAMTNLYDDIKSAGRSDDWNMHHKAINQKKNAQIKGISMV